MSSVTVLLAGVTGLVGQTVVEELLKHKNIRVRALVQTLNPSDSKKQQLIQHLQQKGVELYVGSVLDKNSLKEAVQGVDVGISTVSGGLDITVTGQKNLVDALTSAGTKLFFPSGFGLYDKNLTQNDNPFIFAKKEVNDYAESKGLKIIFIQNGLFYNFIKMGYVDNNTKKFIYYGDKNYEFLAIDVQDIGKVIAAIVNKPDEWNNLPSKFVVASEVLSFAKIEQYAKELGQNVEFVYGGPLSDQYTKYQEALKQDASNFYGWFMYSLCALLSEPKHFPGYTDNNKVPEVKFLSFKEFLKANPLDQ